MNESMNLNINSLSLNWRGRRHSRCHGLRVTDCSLKVNRYILGGITSFLFIFVFHLIRYQLLKERICSQGSKFFKSRPYFERAALSRKANRKSQKLFPFVKMIENHACVLIHLKPSGQHHYGNWTKIYQYEKLKK